MTLIPSPRRILVPMLAGVLLLSLAAPTALATHNVTINSPTEGQSFARNQTITFAASYSNQNCKGVLYNWNFGNGVTVSTPDASTTYAYPLNTAPGTKQVSVLATSTSTQSNCASETVWRNLTITSANNAPVAQLASLASPVSPGASVTLDASASTDADGAADIIRYAFYRGATLLQNTSASSMTTALPTAAGTYDMRVRVTDNLGATSEASRTVTVSNVAPTAALAAIGTVTAGSTFTLNAGGSTDPNGNGDITTYTFSINGAQVASGSSSSFSTVMTSPGDHLARVVVTDAGGLTSEATRGFVVVAGPLSTIVISPDTATVSYGLSRQFEATGTDMWGNPVEFTPVWTVICDPASGGSIDSTGNFTAGNADADCVIQAAGSSDPDAPFETASVAVRAPTVPVPQLPSIVLTAVGLVALAGFVALRRKA